MVTRQMGSSASSPMHSCCTATDLQKVRSCFCLPVATICFCPHFVGPKAAEPMLFTLVYMNCTFLPRVLPDLMATAARRHMSA